jgi:hypothetical protein
MSASDILEQIKTLWTALDKDGRERHLHWTLDQCVTCGRPGTWGGLCGRPGVWNGSWCDLCCEEGMATLSSDPNEVAI